MQKFFEIIKKCPLFAGIKEEEQSKMLACLSATVRTYEKGEFVLSTGDNVTAIGVILSGGVHVLKEDIWGNRVILADIGVGELYGEALSCAQIEKSPVSALAALPSDILVIDYRRVLTVCPSACAFHMTLIKNMLAIMAGKNVMLTQKMEVLTRRTTREKLLAYLSAQAQRAGSNRFSIPFNRQQLAEYLSVDRSAMSAELSRMRDDGILTFEKNCFELLGPNQFSK